MFYNVARITQHFEIFSSSSCTFMGQLQCEKCNRDI